MNAERVSLSLSSREESYRERDRGFEGHVRTLANRGMHRLSREFRFISLMHFAGVRGRSYGSVGVTSDRGTCIEETDRENERERGRGQTSTLHISINIRLNCETETSRTCT